MSETTPAIRELSEKGIPFTVFKHENPVESLEQAARERRQEPEQVVRSIVFRLAEGEYVMVLMAGPRQISWPALRKYLGKSRLTMAGDEELLKATGYRPGTVSPFGLPGPMRVIVDRSVQDQEEVSLGSGERGLAILLKTEDLLRALGSVEIAELGG